MSFMVNVLKNLYSKVSDKMAYANSADQDQKEQYGQSLHCLPFHKILYETMHKKQNIDQKNTE